MNPTEKVLREALTEILDWHDATTHVVPRDSLREARERGREALALPPTPGRWLTTEEVEVVREALDDLIREAQLPNEDRPINVSYAKAALAILEAR